MKFAFALFTFVAVAVCSAAPPTSGQYLQQKRRSDGKYDDYGVTLSNGQVIGQTAGVPAAITIPAAAWGSITGTLSSQTDLQSALDLKLSIATAAATYEPIVTTGSFALSKLATNPLARANHTGSQLLSTISDAGALAALNAVASATITDGTIVNADINASAAIALSKLATDPLARANHTGTQSWSTLTSTPTTLSGYGITDAHTLQAETLVYYQRIIAAGGDIDSATLAAVDELITNAKRDGWWTAVKESYLFCGTNFNAALCKLVTPSGVATNLVNHGFTSAHYSQRGGFGMATGNDSSHNWLETGFVPDAAGLSKTNLCLIAGTTSDAVVAGAGSGRTIGDLVPSNAGECGVGFFHNHQNVAGNVSGAAWQTTARNAKVVSLSGGTGGLFNVSADGIPLESWTSSGASSGSLTAEIGLWKCERFGGVRYENGVLGSVFFCSYLTPSVSKLAAADVARFERKIRAIYRQPEMLFWGDSITAHQGATVNNLNAFSSQVAKRLGFREWNMGSLSEFAYLTTNQIGAVDQLPDILALCPPTVQIMFGTNDGQNSVTDTNYGNSIDTIVAGLVAANIRVILCTPCFSTNGTYTTTVQRNYAVKCAATAMTYGCIFADTNRAIGDRPTPTDYMSDANHPNDAGHTLMAQRIAAAVGGRQERKVTLDLASVAAGATGTQTVEVLTARVGQPVQLSRPATVDSGLVYTARVTADDTVTITYLNTTGSTIDPASAEFGIAVFQ